MYTYTQHRNIRILYSKYIKYPGYMDEKVGNNPNFWYINLIVFLYSVYDYNGMNLLTERECWIVYIYGKNQKYWCSFNWYIHVSIILSTGCISINKRIGWMAWIYSEQYSVEVSEWISFLMLKTSNCRLKTIKFIFLQPTVEVLCNWALKVILKVTDTEILHLKTYDQS